MAVVKQTTLPTVLKEYMPEYEPTFKKAQGEATLTNSEDGHRTSSRSAQHYGAKNSGKSRHAPSKPVRANSPVSRYKRKSADNERIHHVEVPEIPTKVRKQMTNGRLSKIPIRQQPVASPVLSTETPKARSDRSTHPSMPKPSSTRLKCKPASARPKCRGASARSTSKSATRTSATSTSTSTSTTTTGTSQSATPIPNTNEEPSTEGLLKIKRYESLSASWEIAKTEVRRERHQQLQEKLRLQQHLLHLQDELSEHRRCQGEQARSQRRETERSKKQAQQAALQEVCKQSLVEDRKAVAASRRRQGRVEPLKDDLSSEEGHRSPPSTPEQNRPPRHRHYVSRSPTLPKTPMQELDSEEEQEEELNHSASSSDFESLPWHHQQLYKLYGEEADYFIHPKIEPKSDEPVAPKINKSTVEKSIAQPPDEGHVGAEKLWLLLRGESKTKLLKEDGRFPHELKNAYSAFVRESLTLGREPVVRNYTATDDVPDMNKLLDQSLLRNIRKYRHKTGIMYRASRANNDRTNILLYNNPLPDITEGATDTISRYMPSWTDDLSDTSDPAYMKWLTTRQQDKMKQDGDPTNSPEDKDEQKSETNLDLEEAEPEPDPKDKLRPKPKLYFLTEREATTPGDFTERFYRDRNKKDLPQGHTKPPSVKAQSSLGFSNPRTSHDEGIPDGSTRSATFTSKQDLLRRFTSDWQPLSMTALVEYKEQVGTAGNGDFQHGRMKMWPVVPSTTA